MKLLIAEDEKALNEVITKKLKQEGFGVDSCLDGNEALERLLYTDYDLAVLDIMMPGLSGIQVVSKLRAQGKNTPVIFLTALILLMRIYQSTEKDLILQTLENTTDATVSKMRSDKKYREDIVAGKLADRDFYDNDVQIMIYDEKGEHIAGLFLYPELDELPLSASDEPVRTELDGRSFYCCDKKTRTVRGNDLYVRGIIMAEKDLFGSLPSHSTILFAIPVLLTLAFGGGYLMTGRFLKPVRDIRRTAEEIRSGGTLAAVGMSGMAVVPTSGNYIAFGSAGMGGPGRQGMQSTGAASTVSISKGASIAVKDSGGNTVYETTAAKSANHIVFASDELKAGETYTLYVNGQNTVTAALTAGTGQQQGGMPGQPGQGEPPQRPDGQQGEQGNPPERPNGEQGNPPERPNGEQGNPPEKPDGEQGNPPERPNGEQGNPTEKPAEQSAKQTETVKKDNKYESRYSSVLSFSSVWSWFAPRTYRSYFSYPFFGFRGFFGVFR